MSSNAALTQAVLKMAASSPEVANGATVTIDFLGAMFERNFIKAKFRLD